MMPQDNEDSGEEQGFSPTIDLLIMPWVQDLTKHNLEGGPGHATKVVVVWHFELSVCVNHVKTN